MTINRNGIIVGAGPVGLTAALLLGSKGITITVLEAEKTISKDEDR
jgi:2-polyprenyl-6-methoxyphenol hydroxylase-like FAD-dependent oxidoreductase